MKMIFASALALFLSIPAFAHPGHAGHLVFASGKIHAHLSWDQGPDGNGGESIMRVEWHDGVTHQIIDMGLPFEVSLWMPSMGHGSAPTQIQRAIDNQGQAIVGTYQIRNMYFVMPGDWDVRVTLKYQDGTEETQTWSVIVDGEDHGGHHH